MNYIYWTNQSKEDLLEIYKYTSQYSNWYAKSYIENIIKRVEELKDFSNIGRLVPEIKNNLTVREIFYKKYRIIYVIKNKDIYISQIIHSSKLFFSNNNFNL